MCLTGIWICFRLHIKDKTMVDMFLLTDKGHKEKMLLSMPFSRAMLKMLSYFPRALKVRLTFAQRGQKWNGDWSTVEK